MLAGDNSILNQATNAKVETRGGTVQEQVALWKNEKIAKEMTGTGTVETLEQIVNRLVSENLLTEDEKDQILGNDTKGIEATGQVTIGSRTIVFGLTDKEDDLKIGDVVEATGLAKFKDSESQDIEWIYFGKDDSGNNLVTTAKPLKEQFTMNEQPDSDNTKKIENAAKNWLYYDLQETDVGYKDAECTATNNINKFCAKVYSDNGGTVGEARSITLEDINRVTGYTEPTFTPITFGTETGEYNYYYPTIDAKNQDTNTSASPKVYKYWKKVTGASEKTFAATEIHPSYYYDSSTCTSENMKYVIGESNDYLYAVGSRSVRVYSDYADFDVAFVGSGGVDSYSGNFCNSYSDYADGNDSDPVPARPIVSLGSGVQLNKK